MSDEQIEALAKLTTMAKFLCLPLCCFHLTISQLELVTISSFVSLFCLTLAVHTSGYSAATISWTTSRYLGPRGHLGGQLHLLFAL